MQGAFNLLDVFQEEIYATPCIDKERGALWAVDMWNSSLDELDLMASSVKSPEIAHAPRIQQKQEIHEHRNPLGDDLCLYKGSSISIVPFTSFKPTTKRLQRKKLTIESAVVDSSKHEYQLKSCFCINGNIKFRRSVSLVSPSVLKDISNSVKKHEKKGKRQKISSSSIRKNSSASKREFCEIKESNNKENQFYVAL